MAGSNLKTSAVLPHGFANQPHAGGRKRGLIGAYRSLLTHRAFHSACRNDVRGVVDGISLLYDPSCILERPAFCDYHVSVVRPLWRRWIRPQALFLFDGHTPYYPGPKHHALAMCGWGSKLGHRDDGAPVSYYPCCGRGAAGLALLLPAPPGSGKSTLCAGLAYRGWRLLSDELALLVPDTGQVVPLVRPVGLKNKSIDVIRRFAPDAVMGDVCGGHDQGNNLASETAACERARDRYAGHAPLDSLSQI